MPGVKEIRIKIASFKSTQKITKAMEMVAASKMRKAQDRMRATRPYAEKIRRVIGHLRLANPDFKHPFMVEREAKAVGFIVISTDRGLAGGLNVNLFKATLAAMREWQNKGTDVSMCLIGSKGVQFFRRLNVQTLATVTHLGDRPHAADLIGTVKVMLDQYREGKLDRLFLINNEFVNTMSQKPVVRQLLPVVCEMAARMVAMKSATDNAGKLIEELQLIYNKARQAAITKEISEIVGGAAAV
jgi:F-type H+-transporting ATPase subunit gamma